jgi:hypothetical protein
VSESESTQPDDTEAPTRPLVAIKGDASPEEVAALVAVVQAMAAASAAAEKPRKPRSVWADPSRQMRRAHHAGPGGWQRSALPG